MWFPVIFCPPFGEMTFSVKFKDILADLPALCGRAAADPAGRVAIPMAPVLLCHQGNCVTTHARGFAEALFRQVPGANVYRAYHESGRPRIPGTIDVTECLLPDLPGRRLHVATLFAQNRPGGNDFGEPRLLWFRQCLDQIELLCQGGQYRGLAFPWSVGCGLAGGDWRDYEKALLDFAVANPSLTVTLYYNGN